MRCDAMRCDACSPCTRSRRQASPRPRCRVGCPVSPGDFSLRDTSRSSALRAAQLRVCARSREARGGSDFLALKGCGCQREFPHFPVRNTATHHTARAELDPRDPEPEKAAAPSHDESTTAP
jgi:hypothetical protein